MSDVRKIKKRNGELVDFDELKIVNALQLANNSVKEEDRITKYDIIELIDLIKSKKSLKDVESIQDFIETYLIGKNYSELAKNYIVYRYKRYLLRRSNTTDDSILSLIGNKNKDVSEENSNKNAKMCSTQRDLIAGEVSKDLCRRVILPSYITEAHDNGVLHFHDLDYFLQPMFNCCLVNIKDMLDNGTVINGKLIESPKSFQVACIVLTQIVAAVSSGQFGGQSINIKHLGKYLRLSHNKYINKLVIKYPNLDIEIVKSIARDLMLDELKSGIQTIQYQVNTLMSTNGQSPFLSLFLEIDDKDEYAEEVALIIEELLRQRIQGIKNEYGVYITPAFPKLVYVLDEHNSFNGGKYDYITELAVECTSKRMYPDYISAKKMRENYEGNVFSPMGCRSFLSPYKDENGDYKFEGRFNQGVVTINLVQIALLSKNEDEYFKLLHERLNLCFNALMFRHNKLKGVKSDVSPIHWQYGAIARLGKNESIDKYLENNYSTISLGYIGIYEACKLITGQSHTTDIGKTFAIKVMKYLEDSTKKWKYDTGIGFGLYGTPAESLCYRFARIDKEKFGDVEDITDKGYYTNSYHVDVRENISVFDKFKFESEFQDISSGGAISYAEIPNMTHNLEALKSLVKYVYDNILYAEFNTRCDYCHKCNYDGEIKVNKKNEWQCPNCKNTDKDLLTVVRRTCGYLGENFWNDGKTREMASRVTHI